MIEKEESNSKEIKVERDNKEDWNIIDKMKRKRGNNCEMEDKTGLRHPKVI